MKSYRSPNVRSVSLLIFSMMLASVLDAGTITSNNRIRSFVDTIPSTYDGLKPAALIVFCHPGLVSGTECRNRGYCADIAESEGLIVTYPDVEYESWDEWDFGPANDDVIFLKDLIDYYMQNFSIDPGRIYMTGWSEGSMMTSTFLFYYADLLAAACHYKGGWAMQAGIDAYSVDPQPNAPVPIAIVRGEREMQETGGVSRAVQDTANRNYWIWHNKCNTAGSSAISGKYADTVYTEGEAEVQYTVVAGEGHTAAAEDYAHIWNTFLSSKRLKSSTAVYAPQQKAGFRDPGSRGHMTDIDVMFDMRGRLLMPADEYRAAGIPVCRRPVLLPDNR